MADSIRSPPAEVLPDYRRDGKAERHHRQKKRLHHPCADTETRLGRRSKAADDRINEQDVNEEQQKLRACWHTDPQHSSPNLCARPKQRKTKTQVMIFPFEI